MLITLKRLFDNKLFVFYILVTLVGKVGGMMKYITEVMIEEMEHIVVLGVHATSYLNAVIQITCKNCMHIFFKFFLTR